MISLFKELTIMLFSLPGSLAVLYKLLVSRIETLDVLWDKKLMAGILQGEKDIARGLVYSWDNVKDKK